MRRQGADNIPMQFHRELYSQLKHAHDNKRGRWTKTMPRSRLFESMESILENVERLGMMRHEFLQSVVPVQTAWLEFNVLLANKDADAAFAFFERRLENNAQVEKVDVKRLMDLVNLLSSQESPSMTERIFRVAVVGARKLKWSPSLRKEWFEKIAQVYGCMQRDIDEAREAARRLIEGMQTVQGEEPTKRKLASELINLFIKSHYLDAAEVLYYDMRKDGLIPTHSAYASLIYEYHLQGLDRNAVYVYLDLKSRVPKIRDLRIYNSLLRVFAEKGRVDDAFRVLRLIVAVGLDPDVISHTEIVKAYAVSGDLESAGRWISFMSERGVEPNEYAYAIMVDAYSIAQDLRSAINWFSKMQEAGVKPNIVAVTSLITAISRASGAYYRGKLEQVESLINEARGAGISPDIFTYAHLVKMYSDVMDFEGALSVHQRLMFEEVTPNVVMYNSLIYACAKNGILESADQLFRIMKTSDEFPADKYTYTIMLDAYARSQRHSDIEKLIEEVAEAKNKDPKSVLAPDTAMLNCWMNIYNRAGNGTKVIDIFRTQFRRFGVYPDEYTLSVLIDSCNYNGTPADGLVVFTKIVEYQLKQIKEEEAGLVQDDDNFPDPDVFDVPRPPRINNINLYAYVHMLGQHGYEKELLGVLDIARSLKIEPDRWTVICLLSYIGDMQDGRRNLRQALSKARKWWPAMDISEKDVERIFNKTSPIMEPRGRFWT